MTPEAAKPDVMEPGLGPRAAPSVAGNTARPHTSVARPALARGSKRRLPGFHWRQEPQVLCFPPSTSPVLPPGLPSTSGVPGPPQFSPGSWVQPTSPKPGVNASPGSIPVPGSAQPLPQEAHPTYTTGMGVSSPFSASLSRAHLWGRVCARTPPPPTPPRLPFPPFLHEEGSRASDGIPTSAMRPWASRGQGAGLGTGREPPCEESY